MFPPPPPTICVRTSATFPTTGPFTVIVGQEHMLVVGGLGTNTWTVTRGVDNTTAAAQHTVNASVVLPTGNAVTNPANYKLLLNGVEVKGAITQVDYGMSEASELARNAINDPTDWGSYSDLSLLPTNHWEAVLTIDGNGTTLGDPLLGAGYYTLEVLTPQTATPSNAAHSGVTDKGGKALGANGFTLIDGDTTRLGLDFALNFQIITNQNPATGAEFLVNQNPAYYQTFGTSRSSVAEDHSGDFAVVWTSTGEDGDSNPADANYDPNWATDTGVYVRMYDRNNNRPDRRDAGQHLHHRRPEHSGGRDGRRRRLRGRLGQPGPGRQRLGGLWPTVQLGWAQGGGRVPGQHQHQRRPGHAQRGHGRLRQLRRHLGQPRKHLRLFQQHLRPDLQLRRQ